MKMRIFGAILIIIISVPILWIGGMPFSIACGILGIFALKELLDLKEHHKKIPKVICSISMINLLLLLFLGLTNYFMEGQENYRLIAFSFLSLFLPCLFYKENEYSTHDAFYLIACILFLYLFFNSLILLRIKNVWILVYLIFIAIFTDTFAFLIGKTLGRHKCCPSISPNKTWEGSIGGVIFGVAISSVFYLAIIKDMMIVKVFLLSTLLSVLGQLGDLVFSKMKRENKIKDFSQIIPGHGGILDRFDSLLFIVFGYIVLIGLL